MTTVPTASTYWLYNCPVRIHVSRECPQSERSHGHEAPPTGIVRHVDIARSDGHPFGIRIATHPDIRNLRAVTCWYSAHELETDSPLGKQALVAVRESERNDDSRLVRVERPTR